MADGRPVDGTAALDAASAAASEWALTAPRERGEILRRAYDEIARRTDELALLMTLEMGKPLAQSRAEVTYANDFLRWFSEEAARIDGRYAVSPDGNGRLLTMKQPVGPCLLITPWNFPLAMGTRKIGPAIAAGATMVVKPARATPLSMLKLAEILGEAGLPDGVLNVLTSTRSGELIDPLIDDPRVCASFRSPVRRRSAPSWLRGRRRGSCGSRWSSAGTRRSSSSGTPTSTRRSTAR